MRPHQDDERTGEAGATPAGGEAVTHSEIWVYVALIGALILIWSY